MTATTPVPADTSGGHRAERAPRAGWRAIARKELGDHVHSARFGILIGLVALAGLAAAALPQFHDNAVTLASKGGGLINDHLARLVAGVRALATAGVPAGVAVATRSGWFAPVPCTRWLPLPLWSFHCETRDADDVTPLAESKWSLIPAE